MVWNIKKAALAVLLVCAASPVAASDGVIEINQHRAAVGGITAGDSPGFPVTISASGSYILTGNLDLSSVAAVDAIQVTADHVVIDLNGFEIVGNNSCSFIAAAGKDPASVSCTNAAANSVDPGKGITGQNDLTVRNGTVRRMANIAISCDFRCRVEDVRVSESLIGITTRAYSLVQRSESRVNLSTGILTGNGDLSSSRVFNNLAMQNGARGFFLGGDSLARDNVSMSNVSDGFFAEGGQFFANLAQNNGEAGFGLTAGAILVDNRAVENDVGLEVLLGTAALRGNSFVGNSSTITGSIIELGDNFCETNTTCP